MTEFKKYYSANDFNPEDFEWVDAFDSGASIFEIRYTEIGMPQFVLDKNGNRVKSHTGYCYDLLKEQGYGRFEGHCQHCGQNIRWACIYHNIPNDELVVVGMTCAENRMGLTLEEFKIARIKEQAQAQETRKWRAEQKSAWLKENPERAELITWLTEQLSDGWDDFYNSLLRHFENNGNLTEAQEAAAWKSKARQEQWEKERAEQAASSSPAPTGRVEVTGTVLKTKWVESQWGNTQKMIVLAEEGFRVWCTIPTDLQYDKETLEMLPDLQKGDKVKFTVTLTPSDDDETFAWGKRPTKASIIERAA